MSKSYCATRDIYQKNADNLSFLLCIFEWQQMGYGQVGQGKFWWILLQWDRKVSHFPSKNGDNFRQKRERSSKKTFRENGHLVICTKTHKDSNLKGWKPIGRRNTSHKHSNIQRWCVIKTTQPNLLVCQTSYQLLCRTEHSTRYEGPTPTSSWQRCTT